ncbi:unnamed protein product [Lota lota]
MALIRLDSGVQEPSPSYPIKHCRYLELYAAQRCTPDLSTLKPTVLNKARVSARSPKISRAWVSTPPSPRLHNASDPG